MSLPNQLRHQCHRQLLLLMMSMLPRRLPSQTKDRWVDLGCSDRHPLAMDRVLRQAKPRIATSNHGSDYGTVGTITAG